MSELWAGSGSVGGAEKVGVAGEVGGRRHGKSGPGEVIVGLAVGAMIAIVTVSGSWMSRWSGLACGDRPASLVWPSPTSAARVGLETVDAGPKPGEAEAEWRERAGTRFGGAW